MNYVRTFLILICAGLYSDLHGKPIELELAACSLRLKIAGPAKTLRQGDGWIIINRSYPGRGPARMIVRCKQNTHHTSLVSDLRSIARKRLHVLRFYREIELHRSVAGAYYLKSRIHRGRRIISIDGYFATRSFEYHINIIPTAKPKAGTKFSDYEYLVGDLGAVMRDLRFTKEVQPAITEAAYRQRLNILVFLLAAVGLAVLFFFYIRYRRGRTSERKRKDKKKRKHPTIAKDADRTKPAHDSHD